MAGQHASDLVADLEMAGLSVRVAPPGSVVGQMPCVTVAPADDQLGGSGRYVERGYLVTAMVARGAAAQLDALDQLAEAVLVALLTSGWQLNDRMAYVGSSAEDVQYHGRQFQVTADGQVIC